MRVLGIDPSLRSTGFGIVEEDGGRLVPVAYGIIKPTASLPLHLKLAEIKAELETIMTGCGFAEYSALEIKKAVTGYGQADKEQVLTMVRSLLGLDDDDVPLDASDALAAAICHLNARSFQAKVDDKEPS